MTGADVWVALLKPPYPSEVALTPQERERSAGFLRPEAGQRWAASRTALRQVLSTYLGEPPEGVAFELGENGKPRLADRRGLEFNLSHSHEIALVAVSWKAPVGIDVEKIDPGRDLLALAERAFDPGDVAAVRAAAAGERAAVFYERWARHEARLKCLGVGLGARTAPVELRDLDVAPGYAAAVAVARS